MPIVLLVISFFVFSAGLARSQSDLASDGESWWSRVKVLADDRLEGRLTGSEGYRQAAAYVMHEFEANGLKPAGTKGYYQPVLFRVRKIIEEQSSLELMRDGQLEHLVLGEDANFGLPADVAPSTQAAAVFVGHGLVIPEMGINDLAGLDLKGKIAVLLSGGPKEIPGPVKAHYSSVKEQWRALRQAGAIGMARIDNPKSMDIPWSRAALARFQPTMSLADQSLDDSRGMKISLRINPAKADKFLAGSGHSIQELLRLADANQPLPYFPLAVRIRAKVAAQKSQVESPNIAAVLEGSDPALKREYVVLSAHLDHLGIGEPIDSDRIYNGAMDNASGVAAILEVTRWLKQSKRAPKRSLLFLAVTGEEKGLQGSKYFANHPTVPRRAIVADLNTDMFLPIHELKMIRVFGLDESSLGSALRTVCARAGVDVQPDPEPDRNIFIRSDQYSFTRQGVPSIFFGFGYAPATPEEELHKQWLKTRYHAPSDDCNQPVDKAAAARFNRILLNLTEVVANDPQKPQWEPQSFFRRFAQQSRAR